MTYTVQTPIIGPSTGTAQEALSWLDVRAGAETEYVAELWRLCGLVNMDAACLFAQWAHETGDGSSYYWLTRKNPAGLGITGDPAQNEASHTWANGTEAAQAHIVHMSAYTKNNKLILNSYLWTDPRVQAVIDAGYLGSVKTINDLTGRWATDPNYEAGIVRKLNLIFPNRQEVKPMAITFGRVPKPTVIQSLLPASNPYVKESGAPDIPEAIFWHRMIGSWNGTNNWFHQGKAATAYGVAVAATDGPFQSGRIYEWIEPGNGWYGESSGPVVSPYGDGVIYVDEVGVDNVNRLSKAIEISGDVDTPLDERARDAIANITAYWADQKRIPWNEFPHYKAKGRSYVIWHNEVTGMAYKTCPGTVVMNETNALIERTKQVMKRHQVDAVPPTEPEYAKPSSIHWKRGDVGPKTVGGTPALAFLFQVTARRRTWPLSHTGVDAKRTGPDIEKGETVTVMGSYVSNSVGWIVREDGSRLRRSHFAPALPLPTKP